MEARKCVVWTRVTDRAVDGRDGGVVMLCVMCVVRLVGVSRPREGERCVGVLGDELGS